MPWHDAAPEEAWKRILGDPEEENPQVVLPPPEVGLVPAKVRVGYD